MNARRWGVFLLTIAVLTACDTENVAGTNNETHTKGTFFQANGKVAVGARVRVFAASQEVGDSTTVLQTQVDSNGQVPLRLPRGYYSLLAIDTLKRAVFLDSIFSDGDTVRLRTDTLRPTGTLLGQVRVQPWDSPAIAWVHLMRTNLFAKVDSSGSFRLTGVPAGSFDLVAACDRSEYTPTHRQVRSLPDSTKNLGDIELVYNGLPAVTGLQASYDTLSGVVSLKWHDTTYARKMGYLVYRRMDSSSTLPTSPLAFTTTASYSDTVYGGFGAKPSRFDSAEYDLRYWIGTKATDQTSSSPLWNEVRLHVKSPAQSRLWKVTLDSIPIGLSDGFAGSIDTTEYGLLLLSGTKGDSTYMSHPQSTLLRRSLQWDPAIRHDSGALWFTGSVFWKGRVWQCAGYSSHDSMETDGFFNSGIHYAKRSPIFDSILIRSSSDGDIWDSTHIAIGKDSVTSFQFRPHSERLEVLLKSNLGEVLGTRSPVLVQGKLSTADGTSWMDANFDLTAPGEFLRVWINQLHYSRSIGPGGEIWTEASRLRLANGSAYGGGDIRVMGSPSGWLIPGEDTDTSHAILQTSDNLHVHSRGDLLAVGSLLIDMSDSRFQSAYSAIALASPDNPIYRQRIELPEPILDFCFWQGKLVILSESRRLYIATISKIK